MEQFIWPFMLLILPLPLLVRRFLKPLPPRGGVGGLALRAPFFERAARLGLMTSSPQIQRGAGLFLTLGWVALVVAAMRPVGMGEPIALPREVRHLVLAVDVSGSMAADDFALNGRRVSRLEIVKHLADDFIQKRAGDRIGLVLFGTEAYVYAPLSRDTETLRSLLSEVGVGIAGERTAIGEALALAVEKTASLPADSRVIILLSDGKSNAGMVSVAEATALAQKHDAKVYTVGIGAPTEAYPDFLGLSSGRQGDLDEETLKSIAAATNGQYFRATSTADLKTIYETIDALETHPDEADELRPQKELFYFPLLAALFFFACVLGRRRTL